MVLIIYKFSLDTQLPLSLGWVPLFGGFSFDLRFHILRSARGFHFLERATVSEGYGQSGSNEPLRPIGAGFGSKSASSRRRRATDGDEPFIRLKLMRSLQLRRGLALNIAVTGLALGIVYFAWSWPIYMAQSMVYVQPAPAKVADQGSHPQIENSAYEAYLQQAMQNVTRTDVLRTALNKLGPGAWHPNGETEQAAVERLRNAILVARVGSSYRFVVGAHASDPAVATRMSNAVTASFIESANHDQKAGNAERLTMLSQERDRVQQEMNADRAEQDALNKQLEAAPIEAAARPNRRNDEEITRLRTELVKARTDHDEATARFNAMDANHGPSSAAIDTEVEEMLSSDPSLANSKSSLAERRAELVKQMSNLALSHPEYKKDAAEVAQIDNQLEAMTKDLRAKASTHIQTQSRTDLERTSKAEAQLNQQLRPLVEAATGTSSRRQRSSDLAADILRLQTRFAAVDEQWHSLMLEDASGGSAFVVTSASAPVHPAKKTVAWNTTLIGMAGLLLALLAAVIANKLDPRIYIAADVEQMLGFAPMAQLPDFKDVSGGVAEEHLLRLAAAIDQACQESGLKRCIFTGTGPEAGVTTVVTRVREMLDGMGRRTVLVDASGTLPLPRDENPARAAEPRSSRTTALMQQMAAETEKQDATLVLADTAPLAVSVETEFLARFADCAIVVIQSGVTTRAQLRAVATTLQRLNVLDVGLVLNRVGLKNADRAFRISVEAIEKYLLAQKQSALRRTMRSTAIKVDETAQAQHAGGHATPAVGQVDESVRTTTVPVAEFRTAVATPGADQRKPSRITQAGPELVEEHAARRSARVVLDSSFQIAAFRSSPKTTADIPYPVEATQESANLNAAEDSKLPWWLDDLLSRSEANIAAAHDVPPVVGEPLPGGGVAQRFPVPARGERPLTQKWDAPPQSWEQVLGKYQANQNSQAPKELTADGDGSTPASLSSKLGGLRNLLFVMGLERLNKGGEPPPADIAREPRPAEVAEKPGPAEVATKAPELAPKRPSVVRTITGSTAKIAPGTRTSSPSAPAKPISPVSPVNIPVEAHPATSMSEETTSPDADIAETAGRPMPEDEDASDAEDVQILPSWRGQYKKKS